MATLRQPFQGVYNIVRFNWHFYAIAIGVVIAAAAAVLIVPGRLSTCAMAAALLALVLMLISLSVSHYVYDRSGLYAMSWLDGFEIPAEGRIVNINAGLDEFSSILGRRYPGRSLTVFDFYDPNKHTEVSIKRARRAYPPYPGTIAIHTGNVPLANNTADVILLALAAHEIRDEVERVTFFNELNRALKNDGRVFVTEHLRDLPNFLAYNIGFLHFLSRDSWYRVFDRSGLNVEGTIKASPFITTFVLRKNGAAS